MMRKFFVLLFLLFSTISLIFTTGCTGEEIPEESATETTVSQTNQSTAMSKSFDYS
ncbi:MAG: hypothetical protein ACI4HM_04990 [Ruminococcus sp.]